MCSHPTNSDMIVSGSRDGSLAVWDLRCKAGLGQNRINSTGVVAGAHATPKGKRVRLGKAASMSITSVLYLKNEVSIATSGAVDSIVKFWDIRNLNAQVNEACPYPESAKEPKQGRVQTNVCGCSSSVIKGAFSRMKFTPMSSIGDIPDADIKPPENVLFVRNFNPVTEDKDLHTIFSRFGNVTSF